MNELEALTYELDPDSEKVFKRLLEIAADERQFSIMDTSDGPKYKSDPSLDHFNKRLFSDLPFNKRAKKLIERLQECGFIEMYNVYKQEYSVSIMDIACKRYEFQQFPLWRKKWKLARLKWKENQTERRATMAFWISIAVSVFTLLEFVGLLDWLKALLKLP